MKQNVHTLRGRLWLLLLAMLTIVSQEAQAQAQALPLNDASSNSTAISDAVKAGGTYDATLNGRTIYRDGGWNTLCLPFNMNSDKIASSPLAGAIIKELNTGESSLDGEGKLTLKFTDAAAITAGKPYIVKWVAIKNDDDWDAFVKKVAGGTTYEGKIVKLAADINIASADMVGNTSTPFKGTFDGCGHTINCSISDDTKKGVAPFFYITDATIKNVKVTGSVSSTQDHCAGLVGFANGTCAIQNCWVETDVTVTGSDRYCGGVVGKVTSSSITTISNSLYSGSITCTGTGKPTVGIISGWSEEGGTANINHCLADGTYPSPGSVDLVQGKGTNSNNGSIKKNEESASDLVASLGSEWKVSDDKAVPNMDDIGDVTNPEFSGVTLSSTTNDVSFDIDGGKGKFWFKGTYDPKAITTSDNILLLSSGNRLGYVKSDRTLNAFRAYFEISGTAAVRSYALDFGDDDGQTTGIINVQCSVVNGQSTSATYDLQGRRVIGDSSADNVRLKKGLYIRNGRKVIIK